MQPFLRFPEIDENFKNYITKLSVDFGSTVFGGLYIANQQLIDALLDTLEQAMDQEIFDERLVTI